MKKIKINLIQIADEARDYACEVPALASTDALQIVCRSGDGLEIVDGFHRSAGQIRHCMESGIDESSHSITVVLCEDEDLIAAAAEPGEGQQAAIDAIMGG